MPGADQDHQLHSRSSHHERTYKLSSQECQEQIKTISFIPGPAIMRELTPCQAKNASRADQDHQLHSRSSHHERTYKLSSQECQEQIKTISFIPGSVTMRELTSCQAKNARSRLRPSASFQVQPHDERTYKLSSQECQEQTKTISFIPDPATMR